MSKIPGKNYYLLRHTLLLHSLTVTIIVEKVRELYGVSPNYIKNRDIDSIYKAKAEWVWKKYSSRTKFWYNQINADFKFSEQQAYFMAADKARKIEFDLIYKIADRLSINRHTFEEFILFNLIPEHEKDEFLHIVWNYDYPIDEPGIYLKIAPSTSGEDLKKSFRGIKPLADRLYKVYYGIKTRKKSTGKALDEVKFYRRCESKIIEYYQAKLAAKESQNKINFGDYKKVVDSAIRDLASDNLPDLGDDQKWQAKMDKASGKYKNKYYDITARYNLPTLEDLPPLLRLIPNN